ncbi:TIR domain-containing protein [Agrobacterium tumefaciens]|uniref:TIR domain-containing protein n=1 Tax=Agrobacterium tumefaciens TaxID=358 RepID=UPI00384C5690
MKVFVGYAREDGAAAGQIVQYLEALGLDVWFDKKSLIAGDSWDDERLAAQQSADLIVHLCSEQILTRTGVVNREIRETLRLADDKPFGSNFVVFVRLDGVRLPASFRRYHYIDFDENWQQSIALAVGKKAEQIQQSPIHQASFNRENVSVSNGVLTHRIEEKTDAFELSIEYFEYASRERFWRMVSSHIEAKVLDKYYDFKSNAASIDADELNDSFFRSWEYQVNTEEFYRSGDFVSIRYSIYMYYGGAHGNYRTVTSNFFGEAFGSVSIRDLLENDDEKARKAMSYCLKVVEAGIDEPEPVSWLIDINDINEIWAALADFCFDSRGITFNFSPYVILAYAYGDHEAHMPWSVAAGFIAERYRDHWYARKT